MLDYLLDRTLPYLAAENDRRLLNARVVPKHAGLTAWFSMLPTSFAGRVLAGRLASGPVSMAVLDKGRQVRARRSPPCFGAMAEAAGRRD